MKTFSARIQLFSICTLLILVVLSILGISSANYQYTHRRNSKTTQPKTTEVVSQAPRTLHPAVLGTTTGTLFFTSNSNYQSNGGVIVQTTNLPSQIQLSGYNVNGPITLSVYKATRDDLLDYLLYKNIHTPSDGVVQQIHTVDTTKLSLIDTIDSQIDFTTQTSRLTTISLPKVQGTGVWYLKGSVAGVNVQTMIVRSGFGVLVHQGDNENIFWAQSSTYESDPSVQIDLYNSQDTLSNLDHLTTDQDGIATNAVNAAFDFAIASKGDDFTLVPINLTSLDYHPTNTTGGGFSPRSPRLSSFLFTDRVLYKPGDTVHFKGIIRKDDDATFSIPSGTVTVSIDNLKGAQSSISQTLTISDLGSVDGSFTIPLDEQDGTYSLHMQQGQSYLFSTTDVQVAQYRKPDSHVTVTVQKLAYLPGETIQASVYGEDFLGIPLRGKHISYKVYQALAYEKGDYQAISFSPRIEGFRSNTTPLQQGDLDLDSQGKGVITLAAANTTGYRQFWTIQIQYLDANVDASVNAVQMLIQPGNFVIEASTQLQQPTLNQNSTVSFQLQRNKPDAVIRHVTLHASIGVATTGNTFQPFADGLSATTDENGKASFTFTPTKVATYKFTVHATDDGGNPINDEENYYVYLASSGLSYPTNIFTITQDKKSYTPGDVAHVSITTRPEIKNVFVSLGRTYSRFRQIIPITNGQGSFDVPVLEAYQPNIYIFVSSFLGDVLENGQQNLLVNTADKNVHITITPSQSMYGPREQANFDISAHDSTGAPVQTDLAFWIFDKALLELHGVYYTGIFNAFWNNKWFSIATNHSFQGISSQSGGGGGGGCFSAQTTVLMADGSHKNIDQVHAGDMVRTYDSVESKHFVAAKVIDTTKVLVDGYLILNGTIQVTPEHRFWVNGMWKTASEMKIADMLLSDQGKQIAVTSIEWIKAITPVYNLHIDKFHTYFADDIYVHNDKGETRSVFTDTAYWNPHVQTDENGKAHLSVQLPDNLTTWVAAGISANATTQVGEGQAEFIVNKDVALFPILPQFLRVGDQTTLSSLLRNFTSNDQSFIATAQIDTTKAVLSVKKVTVGAHDAAELSWPITITTPSAHAAIRLDAKQVGASNTADSITTTVPIFEYGSWTNTVQKGSGNTQFSVQPSTGTDPQRLSASLRIQAFQYPQLQTLLDTLTQKNNTFSLEGASNLLIAASILKTHARDSGLVFDGSNLQTNVNLALETIQKAQNANGVWRDQLPDDINPATTRLVLEALKRAQDAGFVVSESMIDSALAYVVQWQPQQWESQVEQQYIFSLFPSNASITASGKRSKLSIYAHTDSSHIAIATLANQRQGFINSSVEENAILAGALETPVQFSWTDSIKNTTDTDWDVIATPTAWSLRALLEETNRTVDQNSLAKAFDYLYRNIDPYTKANANTALATIAYYALTSQLAPSFTYKVFVNDAVLNAGTSESLGNPLSFDIPTGHTSQGASVRIQEDGIGRLSSQLTTKEFLTDTAAQPKSNPITIQRTYINPKDGPIAVGDLVIVQFKIDGLGRGESSIDIQDYLPSGLIAVDQSLNNGNFDPNPSSNATQQLTPQGMHLHFSQLLSQDGVYTYKTRIISQGVFLVPPATVSLTNDPSIYARSEATTFTVDGKNVLQSATSGNSTGISESPSPKVESTSAQTLRYIVTGLVALLVLVSPIVLILYTKRKKRLQEKHVTDVS